MKKLLLLLLTIAPLFSFSQNTVPLQLDELLNFYGEYFMIVTNRAELSNGDRLLSFTPANNLDITDGTPDDTTTYPPPFTPSEVHQLHVLYDANFTIKARLWTIGGITVLDDTIYALQRIEIVDSMDIDPNGSGLYISTQGTPLLATKYNANLELIQYRQLEMGAVREYWRWADGLNAFVTCYHIGYPTAYVYIKQLDKNFVTLDSHNVGLSTALNNYPPYLKSFFEADGGGYYGLYGVNGVGGTYDFDLSGGSSGGTPVSWQRSILVKYDANLSPVWITQIADSYSSFFLVYGLGIYQDDQGRLLCYVYNPDDTHSLTYSSGSDTISMPVSTMGGYMIYEINPATGQWTGNATRAASLFLRGRVSTSTVTNGIARVFNTQYVNPVDTLYHDIFQRSNPIPAGEFGIAVYSDIFAGTVDTYFSLPTTTGQDSLFILDVKQRPDGRLELILSCRGQNVQPDPAFPKSILNYPGKSVRAYTVWSGSNLVGQASPGSTAISLKIYPNPASDILHIETDAPIATAALYDIQGREVQRQQGNVREMDLSALPAGSYIFQMQMKNGLQATKRIIVQR